MVYEDRHRCVVPERKKNTHDVEIIGTNRKFIANILFSYLLFKAPVLRRIYLCRPSQQLRVSLICDDLLRVIFFSRFGLISTELVKYLTNEVLNSTYVCVRVCMQSSEVWISARNIPPRVHATQFHRVSIAFVRVEIQWRLFRRIGRHV
jgi:hypothetical protein